MNNNNRSLGQIFVVPALLLAISLVGLVWALLVEGYQDWLAAGLVALSLIVIAEMWRRARWS